MHRKNSMLALCGEGMLCGVHNFVHSNSGVEFAVEFVLKGFDLASRIKSRHPPTGKVRGL